MLERLKFTLVELMVVISIIVILISLLLPSLTNAKSLAKSMRCMSNLKQAGLALSLYAGDANGCYPPLGLGLTSGRDLWPATLLDLGYCKQNVLTCPTYSKTGFNVFYTYGFVRNMVDYAVSSWSSDPVPVPRLCQKLREAGFSKAQDSSVAFLFDSQEWNSSGNMVYIIRPSTASGTWPGYVWSPHTAGANGLFFDGHVLTMKANGLAGLGYPILP